MLHDAQGLAISTDSEAARDAYDHVVRGYLMFRADVPGRVKALLAADSSFALAHCLQGCFTMMAYKAALTPHAAASAARARGLMAAATSREQAHLAALDAWIDGDLDRTLAIWEGILAAHPHDVVAFRLHHFLAFWLGRAPEMAAAVERVMPHWTQDMPGYGAMLACRCFALEEVGRFLDAEPDGRRAVELDPADLWGAHAVAHVLEMQGRRGEGIAWLTGLAPNWEGGNNLQHHLWWHCGLFHLERGDFAAVLSLYDTRFRDLGSALVQAAPDLYIDMQNAAAMLFRLERQGVDVGTRWEELATLAEARIGDGLSAFTLPHWMMALAATGRAEAADRMMAGLHEFASQPGTVPPIVRDYAIPICEAVRAHRAGAYADAVAKMRPVLGGMWRLGGSHAQQDVLEQLFVDAALRAGNREDVRLALERVAGRRAVPPSRWIGWAGAAETVAL